MRQLEVSIVDFIDTLLQALCEIVSSNGYLARLVPDVAQRENKTIEQKKYKKRERERERGGKKRGLVEEGTEERVHCFCGRIPCIT